MTGSDIDALAASLTPGPPHAVHIGADELPFVEIGGGNKLKVIQVDIGEGLWIVENVFQASYVVQTHRHTGPVYAYTARGAWKYQEYEYVNRAGSFLYEPAGSVHTLEVIEDDTHVWFQMYGSNLNLDADGNIESVFDGPGTLEAYYMLAEAEGFRGRTCWCHEPLGARRSEHLCRGRAP